MVDNLKHTDEMAYCLRNELKGLKVKLIKNKFKPLFRWLLYYPLAIIGLLFYHSNFSDVLSLFNDTILPYLNFKDTAALIAALCFLVILVFGITYVVIQKFLLSTRHLILLIVLTLSIIGGHLSGRYDEYILFDVVPISLYIAILLGIVMCK